MKFHKSISIVPALPPIINGVGDYAYVLAMAMEEKYGIESFFLNTNSLESKNNYPDKTESLSERSKKSLASVLNKQAPELVILHFVGYAYNTQGLPFWLLRGLKAWKNENPDAKLITIFHELYAQGPLWQKEFWTAPLQKKIAFDLQILSDFSVANTEITQHTLRQFSPKVRTTYLPVFSNVGEPESQTLFSERRNRLVIFGSAEVRARLFKEKKWLENIVKKFEMEEVVEIGASRHSHLDSLKEVPVIQQGILSKEKISELLLQSKFGIVHYPQHLLTKSGIYAAYCSHGVVPLVIDPENKKGSELKPGEHYLIGEMKGDPEKISGNVQGWYQGHNVEQSAKEIYNKLMEL